MESMFSLIDNSEHAGHTESVKKIDDFRVYK